MKKNLDFFNSLKYDIVIHSSGEIYYLTIPELSLIEENSDLTLAYKNLENKKAVYFMKMLEAEMEEYISLPLKLKEEDKSLDNMLPWLLKFLYKTLLIILLFWIGFIFINKFFLYKVRHNMQKFMDMSVSEKTRKKQKLEKIVNELKPFMNELKPLWEESLEISVNQNPK